jgi:hypothetical protein
MSVLDTATVGAMEPVAPPIAPTRTKPSALDAESQEWLRTLRAGDTREEAIARLHALLLRAARFEVARRRPTLPHLRGNDLDDIANEAADDALMSVLRRLDDFHGASRFSKHQPSYGNAPGKAARSRSSPKAGTSSRVSASSPTPKQNRASCS